MTRIAVIGAGTVGSQVARALAGNDVEVDIYDRFNSPNPWGAHGGESRLIRSVPYLETAPGDRAILEASIPAWKKLESESGRPTLNQCGGLIIGNENDPGVIAASSSSGVVRFTQDTVRERFPQFALRNEIGLLDEQGGLVDPQHAVIAALELAIRGGARVHQRTRVTGLSDTDHGVRLSLEGGATAEYDRVVVATGSFAQELLPEMPVIARRLLLGWYEPLPGREGLIDGMPSFVWSPAPGHFLYGGPSEDGRTIKVGVDAPWGDVEDALSGRSVSAQDIEPAREMVSALLPWVDAETGRYEMHIDGWSTDGHGVLGALPDHPNVIAAVGWSGHGFKISPVLGEIIADLVLNRTTQYDVSHLDPRRMCA